MAPKAPRAMDCTLRARPTAGHARITRSDGRMDYEHIGYTTVDDSIAVVTLNRPQRLNAITPAVLLDLFDAAERIQSDPAIRVWLLTGAPRPDGRPCFSAGVDLKDAAEGGVRDPELGLRLANLIDDMLTPSIAVIDGICTTGGGELAVSCDLRLVGEAAQISDWHLKNLGTGPGGWGSSTRWARLVGAAKAKELFLTGKVMGAQEAYDCGFATSVHPSSSLMEEALVVARQIAQMNPAGVRLTLAHIDHTRDMSRDEALRWVNTLREWFDMPLSRTDYAARRRNILGEADG
jgi:enoyl-CoA hydratase/carnithine racemase